MAELALSDCAAGPQRARCFGTKTQNGTSPALAMVRFGPGVVAFYGTKRARNVFWETGPLAAFFRKRVQTRLKRNHYD